MFAIWASVETHLHPYRSPRKNTLATLRGNGQAELAAHLPGSSIGLLKVVAFAAGPSLTLPAGTPAHRCPGIQPVDDAS